MKTGASLSPRERILRATAALLAEGGREAVSTRSVGLAADVSGPTIYRQFGDMQGLLAAVAADGYAQYLRSKKARPPAEDPVDDLRQGWDLHVEFGLANPAVYVLMYGNPRPGQAHASAAGLREVLAGLVERAAGAGRLRVSVGQAVRAVEAAGVGVVLYLIAAGPPRDPRLSQDVREAVLSAITTVDHVPPPASLGETPGHGGIVTRAVALKAVLAHVPTVLTGPERCLLEHWLDRLSEGLVPGPTH